MSLVAKDFLFQLQLLVARAGSDLSLRKSLTADTLSALTANGLQPPKDAFFEVTEDKTPFGVVKQGSRFFLNLPNLSDLHQISFSINQNTALANSAPCNGGAIGTTAVEALIEVEVTTSSATATGPSAESEVTFAAVGEAEASAAAEIVGFF